MFPIAQLPDIVIFANGEPSTDAHSLQLLNRALDRVHQLMVEEHRAHLLVVEAVDSLLVGDYTSDFEVAYCHARAFCFVVLGVIEHIDM